MKTKLFTIAALACTLTIAAAAEKMKAPNGGRIIAKVTPHAEFLVSKDKKIEVRFLTADGKVTAPEAQVVTVTMGDRANPTKLTFTKEGDKLISDKAIPEGEKLPVVLQIAAKEGEKAVSEKFTLDMSKCPPCGLLEYACTCASH